MSNGEALVPTQADRELLAHAAYREGCRDSTRDDILRGDEFFDENTRVKVSAALRAIASARKHGREEAAAFQTRVDEWLLACFGEEIARDRIERNHRFLEEALELVQACGCTASEAHQLVDYTFGRPVGERGQEVGGVMNTLAALCLAYDMDMTAEGDREIDRCWIKIERIREKQRNKPKHSPLPEAQAIRSLTPISQDKG